MRGRGKVQEQGHLQAEAARHSFQALIRQDETRRRISDKSAGTVLARIAQTRVLRGTWPPTLQNPWQAPC
jgi:hypothetical protein